MERISKKKNNRPIIFILLLSIVLMVVLFFVQSRSDKSIRAMQDGNTLAVKTFQINNTLQEIINHSNYLESESRKQLNNKKQLLSGSINKNIAELAARNLMLKKLTEGYATEEKYKWLNILLDKKIILIKSILDKHLSIDSSKAKLTGDVNKNLIDSIYILASDIQIGAEKQLQLTIIENSKVSNQVLIISRALTIFALITILLSATLIIQHLSKNLQLINELEIAKEKADFAGNIKEQFLANMSHEIRTPLNSIIGFSNLASKTKLDGEQKDFIHFIKHSSENLLYIINDILDFSKLEAGKLQISKAPFNLQELTQFIEMLFQVQLKEKKIHFSLQMEEEIPLDLTGDDDRLKQILTNLISNAIKFTGIGGNITLKISAVKKEDETVFLRFAVKDSGIGIPEDKLKSVFERFEQADSATTRKYGGTGLGLSIVKQLVALQHGEVEVKSTVNIGSEFIVTIPYTINFLADDAAETTISVIKRQYNKAARILIAEDNKMNQLLLTYLFRNWGMKITLAMDGQEAIDLLKKEEFDLVLLDIQMPIIDGYGVAKWIRQDQKMNIPIVAMTAHTMPTEIDNCMAAGMNDYLPKPLREEQVIALFNKYIPSENWVEVTETNSNSPKYVDIESMKKLFGDEPTIIHDFLSQFTEHFGQEMNKLRIAFAEKNQSNIFTIAHNLKTTVSALNANTELLVPLKLIEQYKKADPDWDLIEAKIDILSNAEPQVSLEIATLQKQLLA